MHAGDRSTGLLGSELEKSCDSIRGTTGDGTKDNEGTCLLRLRG